MSGHYQVILKSRENLATGMFLLVFGLFFGGIPLAVILSAKDAPVFIYLFPLVGFSLGLLGLKFVFTMSGLDVDIHGERLRQWTQFLWKRTEEFTPVSSISQVSMTTKVIRTSNSNGGSSSKTVYPVTIEVEGGSSIHVAQCNSQLQARARGEKTAKLLKVSLADDTSGTLVVRDHDKLDETVGARLLREDAKVELKSAPTESGLNFDAQDSKGVISIPAQGMAGMIPAFIIFVVGGIFVGVVSLVSRGDWFVVLFMGIPILLVGSVTIWNAMFPRAVEIDQEHLVLKQVGTMGRTIGRIRVAEIEELLLSSRSVMARGDNGSVNIHMLNSDEAAWIKEVLEYILLQMEKSK